MDIQKENIQLESIIELIKKAPTDDGTFSGSLYDLYVFIGIVKGVHNMSNGEYITLDELNSEMEALHGSYNRHSS